ncbi:RNA helicase [Plasmodiophora brassicae]|uniref:RNA helicase n=1 Tax=Plasmodiophora brassicae TaxID=37360 RepID=A0A0G4J7S7_PLABS|nr:hypothetical protein PBRA_003091 [Plasmodiophora brassicae]
MRRGSISEDSGPSSRSVADSAKSAGTKSPFHVMDRLISDELRRELGGSVSILPGRRSKKGRPPVAPVQAKPKLSKSAAKKLARIEDVKEKAAVRKQLLTSLAVNALTDADLTLMHPSGRVGQQLSAKQRAKIAFQRQRSGLPLQTNDLDALYCKRPPEDQEDSSEDLGHAGNDDIPSATLPAVSTQPASLTVVHVSHRPKRRRVVLFDKSAEVAPPQTATGPVSDLVILPDDVLAAVAVAEDPGQDAPACNVDENPSAGICTPEVQDARQVPSALKPGAANAVPVATVAMHQSIVRSQEVIDSRCKLPVYSEEQAIVECIHENRVTMICGATGSGKTTQICQFLYEAGYSFGDRPGMIAITQPRRVAARAMSERVRHEMGDRGAHVGYQVRFENDVSDDTRIKFLTDGILLAEIQEDLLISRYSVIIIDEAHERTLNTDLLIGLLSRIITLRGDLRLVIMSATMRIQDFRDNRVLFPIEPPVIEVASRLHPVTVRFSKRTELDDYVGAAFNKVCKIHQRLPPGGVLVFLTGKDEIQRMCSLLTERFTPNEMIALPLHAQLSPEAQMRVFASYPDDMRLVVVATNVAETSLTIPNIRYVVDSGRHKERVYDPSTGVSSFIVSWISKASADQRSGRAGRTGPGHCYRLYSSAVYNDEFPEFSAPEICELPVDGIVLRLKSMAIDDVDAFPFPTPPDRNALASAHRLLVALGALECGKITRLGKRMAQLPLAPRFAKMVVLSRQANCMPYMIAIVAAETVGQLRVPDGMDGDVPDADRDEQQPRMKPMRLDTTSDLLSSLAIVCAYDFVAPDDRPAFCKSQHVRSRALHEVGRLRELLQARCKLQGPVLRLPPPSLAQRALLIQLIASGLCDQVARKWPDGLHRPEGHRSAYQCTTLDGPVYLHPRSALFPAEHQPELCVYREIVRNENKAYIMGATGIRPAILYRVCPQLCTLSSPLESPAPSYDKDSDRVHCTRTCTFGPGRWPLPDVRGYCPDAPRLANWFALALLQGDVIDHFAALRPHLRVRPSAMVAEHQTNASVLAFLGALGRRASLAEAKEQWRRQPSWLRRELLALVQRSSFDFDEWWGTLHAIVAK